MRRVMRTRASASLALSDRDVDVLMRPFVPVLQGVSDIAVGVSGGGDSLCLLYLLSRWVDRHRGPRVHALTVDHGLRSESATEAAQVARWVIDWPHVTHTTLNWTGRKPTTKIAETARAKRYDLLREYCLSRDIKYLFLAHQVEDQAETVLMRLAAGSGLDGLAGIAPMQPIGDVVLLRPLLGVSHERLCATLSSIGKKWVEDPTNKNTDYLRPRLRAARDVLAAEGLTPERLAQTAKRIARGRAALEGLADQTWDAHVTAMPGAVQILAEDWDKLPLDTQMRVMTRALAHGTPRAKPARLEQIEAAVEGMAHGAMGTKRLTLAGCLVTRGRKYLKITPEK